MKKRQFESIVHATPQSLFAALCDVGSWPAWDRALEHVHHDGRMSPLPAPFRLKPRGRPEVAMTIERMEAPHSFAVAARLPLARMRTAYSLIALAEGQTRVCVEIETHGLLAMLWDRLIARELEAGAQAHAKDLAAFARLR